VQKISTLLNYLNKNHLTDYEGTLKLSRFGLDLSIQHEDHLNKGNFLRLIGGAFVRKGKIDSATVYYYNALKELEPYTNNEKLGLLYDDMARMYRKLSQSERALEFYDKALKLYEATDDQEGIARIYNESGVVFRDNGDYLTANQHFEKSLDIQLKRNDSTGIAYAYDFLGSNQTLLKNFDQAEKYLKQALIIREKMGDAFATMLSYTSLGEYYLETNQLHASNTFFEKSNAIARKINFQDIQKYNYEQLVKNYEAVGDYEKAFHSLKNYWILNDSLYNVQKLKDVEEITAKYEAAERENLILQQRAKISSHRLELKNRLFWIFGLTSLAVVIGLAGFLLYKQQVHKNLLQQEENNKKLSLEKNESQHKLQEQRLSISRDLHDNIGAQLSFIVSSLETIKYHVPQNNEKIISRLQHVDLFARETIRELRDTIWAMNKDGISIKELQSRIANFIEKAKHSHPTVDMVLLTDEHEQWNNRFTGLQGLNIFRVVQEAIINALKYAHPNKIEIHIRKRAEGSEFVVRDDGDGFVESEVEPGNGLANMRKRTSELGGNLMIESSLGKGTVISFLLIDNNNT
jgi:signal transduction histidine kinase